MFLFGISVFSYRNICPDIQSGKHYYSKIINKKSRDKYFICQKKHENKISKKIQVREKNI